MLREGGSGLPASGTVATALLDQAADALQLDRSDDGADIGRFVERVANAQARHPRPELFVQALGHAFLDQQAAAGAADLTLVEPDRIDEPLHGAVEIGVLEHHERRLAAELEGELLARAGG